MKKRILALRAAGTMLLTGCGAQNAAQSDAANSGSDDLQQDRARQVLAGLGVDDLEVDLVEHHLLDVGERDVAAVGGVVEPAIRILLDQTERSAHGGLLGADGPL